MYKEILIIKESIQYTIQLIEDIHKVNPAAYQEERIYLDGLVQHMKVVVDNLDKKDIAQTAQSI
jgi:hypothetical protein